jgi:hypothetical protein
MILDVVIQNYSFPCFLLITGNLSYINNVLLSDEFLVVPEKVDAVVMGGATIRKWRIKLNFDTNSVYVGPKVARPQLIWPLRPILPNLLIFRRSPLFYNFSRNKFCPILVYCKGINEP